MPPTTETHSNIASRFEILLGASSVLSEQAGLQKYSVDGVVPRVVVQPATPEQLGAVLRIASEENWTVTPFGVGTRQHVGRLPEQVDIVLSTEKLGAIEAYDPGDLTISLEAGVSVGRAVGACAEHRQLLAIEAPSSSTIGGSLAAGTSGRMRCAFGGLRDFCIGVKFVTGDGVFGRGGGRVVKNVAGYDLMKLMIGSYGSLGVIVSANFKLFPMPQQTMTCICEFASAAELFLFRDRVLKSPLSPLAAEFISPTALEYLSSAEPRDPDSWAPAAPIAASEPKWQLALTFAGSDRVLARCRQELGPCISLELNGVKEQDFWQSFAAFEARLMSRHPNAMIFQVDFPLAESESVWEAAQAAATDYNFVPAAVGRVTVGSFVIAFAPLAIDPPSVTQFAGAASHFRSRLSRAASAVVMRCPREAKQHFDVWGSTPTDIDLMQKIKHALDPKGILNRGRFLTG